jgi:phosphatidylglycerol---prolipoprotein diacylglyceryl transferase
MLEYPDIDPVAFRIFGLSIHWYALAYIAGIMAGVQYAIFLSRRLALPITKESWDSFVNYAVLGIIIGGRLGYVLFYKPLYYLENPLDIVKVWEGGMAFHGGFLGVVVAVFLFCRRHLVPLWVVGDCVAAAAPIGLFFGRLANFVNGELYGRVTDSALGMVFPNGGDLPRHPSQLYEALSEGLLLFLVLAWLIHRFPPRNGKGGVVVGAFIAGYGICRFLNEFTREPDSFMGLFAGLSAGQWYSLPMVVVGLALVGIRIKKHCASSPRVT